MELAEVRSALAVAAHPDDIESWCAGTVAALTARGARVAFLLLTSGDKGSPDPLADPRRVAEGREVEQRAAARVLGVSDLTFLRRPDGELTDDRPLRRAIAAQIRRVRPDLLLTFDPWRPYAFHRDHREGPLAALAAAFLAARPATRPGGHPSAAAARDQRRLALPDRPAGSFRRHRRGVRGQGRRPPRARQPDRRPRRPGARLPRARGRARRAPGPGAGRSLPRGALPLRSSRRRGLLGGPPVTGTGAAGSRDTMGYNSGAPSRDSDGGRRREEAA